MIDIDYLRQWIGREQTCEDTIDLATCRRIEATLDQLPELKDGDPLPPLWHWCWFHNPERESVLGPDGHSEKGNFLPPVPLPRRMWAGGRFDFENPLPIGAKATKKSTITSIELKQGKSGKLCFVTVEHCISYQGNICFTEVHDIVYRGDPKPGDTQPIHRSASIENPDFIHSVTPTPTMLFRFSALTFNSHRIHYDRDYCRDVEGYPGLVFHGPLTATLLINLAANNNPGQLLKSFEYRAISPIFEDAEFKIIGSNQIERCELQAVLPGEILAMKAMAHF